jgi:hypothetical protein
LHKAAWRPITVTSSHILIIDYECDDEPIDFKMPVPPTRIFYAACRLGRLEKRMEYALWACLLYSFSAAAQVLQPEARLL